MRSSTLPCRFSVGVILFHILAGLGAYPFLSEEDIARIFALPEGSEQNQLHSETVATAPGVLWPERLRDLYARDAPQLVALVEGLLNRNIKDRAGFDQVRADER